MHGTVTEENLCNLVAVVHHYDTVDLVTGGVLPASIRLVL